MSATSLALQQATILQHCKVLHLPTVGGQCGPLAAQAVRERHTHLGYLEALLATEVDERERHAIARRLKEAHLPRVKTLDEFDFSQASKVSATQIRELADGGYIARTEPVVLIGDCGAAVSTTRSRIVGIPSGRWPTPLAFGIITRRTGCGL
jgi:DNA replication protein DnaC